MSKTPSPAAAEKPAKEPKPKKEKKEKKPGKFSRSPGFSPVASAMYEIQRREATGDVISGAAFILLGIIIVLVSISRYIKNMDSLTADAEKYFAYGWIVIAITGVCIGVIGIYEILKSFISMEQINEWARNAESHASPLQSINEKRKAAQMNQSQSTEPAPTEGMAEDGGKAKKHFAFLGKKPEPKPDKSAVYEKYNPPQKPAVEAPPRAKPMMEQKFDYGIHEEKKQSFADKFLAENKEDPFAQYRKDLGMEEEKPEEFVQKPQFIRNASENPAMPAAPSAQAVPDMPDLSSGGLFERLAASQGIETDSGDGFFLGTSANRSENIQSQQQVQQQLSEMQQQVQQLQKAQEQIKQVQNVQEQLDRVARQAEQVEQVQQQMESVQRKVDRVAEKVQQMPVQPDAEKPMLSKEPPVTVTPPRNVTTASPTIKPPAIPKNAPSATVKPPAIPKTAPSDTIKPPAIPKTAPSNTITPPPIPQQTAAPTMPPMPQQMPYGAPVMQQMRPMAYSPVPPVQNMYQPLPNLQGMQGGYQTGYVNSPFGFAGAFVDPTNVSYNPAMPPYTVHPFRPASPLAAPQQGTPDQAYNSAMPPYTVHPFKPASPLAAPQQGTPDQAYNSAMPPYTVHPFKPSSQLSAPQQGEGDQSYNSAMPPYTVHPFKPASAEIAAPQIGKEGEQEQSYNSQMPHYTVHPFKPASAEIAAPQAAKSGEQEQSYNPQMPPYTVHPFKPASAEIAAPQAAKSGEQEQSYNSQMPPYTVHPFKPASAEIAAPQAAKSGEQEQSYNSQMPPYTVHPFRPASAAVTPPPVPPQESYNSAMPPYTVHPFKAKDPAQRPLTPQLSDSSKVNSEGGLDLGMQGSAESETQTQTAVQPSMPVMQSAAASANPINPQTSSEPENIPAENPVQSREEEKSKHQIFGVKTQRGQGDENVKKPPITQRLGEYTFSLFEELSGKGTKNAAPKTMRGDNKKQDKNEKATTGGNEMAFNFKGGNNESEQKKSFSERFLSRNGKKAANGKGAADSDIVKGGTPAQRKFVDASEFDEWICPGCGATNQEYCGVCACGERKPRNTW